MAYKGDKTKKGKMRKFRVSEISPVDRPAMSPALAVLMKNVDESELVKATFAEALTELKLEDKIRDILSEQFTLNEALRLSFRSIVEDKETYPNPVEAVKQSLQEFATAVIGMISDAKESLGDDEAAEKADKPTKTEGGSKFFASDYAYVPDAQKPSTWKLRLTNSPGGSPDPRIVGAAVAALGPGFRGQKVQLPSKDRAAVIRRVRSAWLKANPGKTREDLPSVLKSEDNGGKEMSKDKTPTVEELAEDLKKVQSDLEISKKYGELNDAEKAHYAKLGEDEQATFLDMSAEERGKTLAKAQEADAVVYTADDGTEYRKSDDPRLVAMAKERDEDRKALQSVTEKLDGAEYEKRASEDLKSLPGDQTVKVAVLRAVDGIKDEETRKKAHEMLKSHNEGMSESETTKGTKEAAVLDAEQELDKMAKDYSKEHEISYAKAYDEVCKTERGKELYELTVNK
jgi:hypothetical protein